MTMADSRGEQQISRQKLNFSYVVPNWHPTRWSNLPTPSNFV